MQQAFPADRFYQAIRNDRVAEVAELVADYSEALEWAWQDDHRPLHFAALFGSVRVLHFLLSAGANREARIRAPQDPSCGEDHALRALRHGCTAQDLASWAVGAHFESAR